MSIDQLAQEQGVKDGNMISALKAELSATESERKHHENTAGCLRTDLEYMTRRAETAERERDEARAKLAEHHRRHIEAEKEAVDILEEWHAPYAHADEPKYSFPQSDALQQLISSALTAAHARGYAAGVAQEREECATAVDALDNRYASTEESYGYRKAAAAIRNRSGQ